MNNYKVVDLDNWKRSIHCQVFRNSIEPAFCITFDVDITNYLSKIKEKGLSFTLAMIHAISKIANSIEEFRYRFIEDDVVLFDSIDTAFTFLDKNTELFKVINAPYIEDLERYVENTKEIIKNQKDYFTGPLGNDVFQCSPLPFITYSHISHTNSGKKNNATPLFDWGKYYSKDDRIIMPLSVQAHHSFVDGIHIGKFANALQEYLNSY